MSMYQHIVVAVDGSENAFRAAQEACKIAKFKPDALVEIVYVVDFEKVKNEMLHAGSTEALELMRHQKTVKIEQLYKREQMRYKTTILRGTPGPEIIKYVNANSVDLLVIGSRGLNSLQELVLGSVSHKVMKRVQCPVLMVK